jgi:glycosyltransferase involved in cell wall biosynthesis
MEDRPEISVIIPTYNRAGFLLETLKCLVKQSFPASRFEVIVVDDGSAERAQDIIGDGYPFALRCIYQDNKGDAEARNMGAVNSNADLLVFLDDDVLVGKEYLSAIVAGHKEAEDKIIVGTQILWIEEGSPPIDEPGMSEDVSKGDEELSAIKFSEVCSNNMSLRRESYSSIGLMESMNFSGSSMWCDVDFAYRSSRAVCWHRDYVSINLDNQKRRWREVAYRAVTLFSKYPQLAREIPMFDDKTPIDWRFDSPGLVIRKMARHVTSSRIFLWPLEFSEKMLDVRGTASGVARHLQRWIIGGYIFQGYREGLREKSQGPTKPVSGFASK